MVAVSVPRGKPAWYPFVTNCLHCMKTSKRYRLSALVVAAVAAGISAWTLVGCSKQLAGGETTVPVEVTLPSLVIEPAQSLTVASAVGMPDGTPAETATNSDLFSVQLVSPTATASADTTPTKATTTLSNVWVLQFDGAGTTRACVFVGTVNAGSNILATLESGEGYSVWIVANGPANGTFTTANPATLSDFESKLLYTGKTTSDGQIPLCGKVENVTVLKNGQLLVGNNNATVPSVLLRRAQARVDMILQYEVTGAVFDGAWLYNVPTGACYGLLESAADGFPAPESGNFSYTDGFADGATPVGAQGANSTYTWYMGDNRRGTQANILYEIQKNQANAPQYATYIRIKGHEEADETKYIFHDVFLGKTKTSDFNVLRNWNYTFHVRIGGTLAQQKALAGEDPRVSAGTIPNLTGSVTPSVTDGIPQAGGNYTVTLSGSWSGGAIQVRVISNNDVLIKGTITFNEALKGGSTTLNIPPNESETRRPIVFQYLRYNSWIAITSGSVYQNGVQFDAGANFIMATDDAPNPLPWQEAIEYCKSMGDGWRLPTHNEAMLMNCMYPALSESEKFSGSAEFYWTATEYSQKRETEAWYADLIGGNVLYASINSVNAPYVKTYSLNTRCVKSKPAEEISQRYPYVDEEAIKEGKFVIVMQDENGGFPEAMLFANRLESTVTIDLKTTSDDANAHRISRRFQVRNVTTTAANLAAAKTICDNLVEDNADNWRVPSIRELMILWMMGANTHATEGDQNDTGVGGMSIPISGYYLFDTEQFLEFTAGYHFASMLDTKNQPADQGGTTVNFSNGASAVMNNTNWSLRCVRDDW